MTMEGHQPFRAIYHLYDDEEGEGEFIMTLESVLIRYTGCGQVSRNFQHDVGDGKRSLGDEAAASILPSHVAWHKRTCCAVYTTRKEVLPMETSPQAAKGVFLKTQFAVFYHWKKHRSGKDYKISRGPVEIQGKHPPRFRSAPPPSHGVCPIDQGILPTLDQSNGQTGPSRSNLKVADQLVSQSVDQ
ncbi:uncharacterized protein CLUP02_08191 [Colletotrichum lupini]|uniref:Uncharacterized protein n=1 Tax=Colletotrichum lupini TaxID=145971 RepID=A0A9Q8WGT0_9PEZI|nr:uncharacterized protein CLUP02_08191 [Colletotrichum lupini]UQC82701.1 hypothetical protein CLUP02_08191 [Colletotrichum lupini]